MLPCLPTPPDIAVITAPNPGPMTLQGTNTYLVGRSTTTVIDPGPAERAHIEAVVDESLFRDGIGGVLLTHSHADHADGVPLLREILFAREGIELDDSDFGHPPAVSGPEGPELQGLATPGHSPDHVCFLIPPHGEIGHAFDGWICFSGDLILGEGSTIVPPAAQGGSLADYMESLRKLQALEIAVIYPGHGPAITEPAARIAEYVAHREEREANLVAALKRGERSRIALLDEVWDDVPAELRAAAAYAMQAHVEKLVAEGKLREDELSE